MILSWLVGSFCGPPLGCLRKYGFKSDEKRIKLFQEWENNSVLVFQNKRKC